MGHTQNGRLGRRLVLVAVGGWQNGVGDPLGGALDAAGICGFISNIGRYPGKGGLISVHTVPLLLSGLSWREAREDQVYKSF